MIKIYISKEDDLRLIIQKILDCPDKEVSLHIQKGSIFEEGRDDFYAIKRKIKGSGKKVIVESFEENIINMAISAGFEASIPFFKQTKKSFIDIIPRKISKVKREEDKEEGEKWSGEEKEVKKSLFSSMLFFLKKTLIFLFISGFIFLVFVLATKVLPRADIHITLKTTDWVFNDKIAILVGDFQAGDKTAVKGQVFKDIQNQVFDFAASGEKYIENKASGKITIYNVYSSKSQSFVKDTRFLAPDGKVFKTLSAVTVPGANIEEGKIISSSIEVMVIAEKPGEEYNIGSISKLRIPGFQGTPKYEAFYGELKEPAKGGFVGKIKVPTESDIASVKEKARQTLRGNSKIKLLSQIPQDLKVLDDVFEFNVIKEEVSKEGDSRGVFRFTIVAEGRVVVFKETDLMKVLTNRFIQDKEGDFFLKKYDIKYGASKVDFKKNVFSVNIEFNSKWTRPFNVEEFKNSVLGKKESEVKILILNMPDVEKADVKFWPFWVELVPRLLEKVKVSYE